MTDKKDGGAMWDKVGWAFLLVFIASDFFSISIAQIAAGGMGLCWLGRWISCKQAPDFSPLKWPLVAFVVSSFVSAALSLDPAESFHDSKDLSHILIFFAVFDLFSRGVGRPGAALRVIAVSGSAIAIVGFFQAYKRGVELGDRISGFNDMYMTYAGLMMMAFIFGLAVLFFGFRKWRDGWLPVALSVILVAAFLSLTRNAWVGLAVGTSALVIMRKPAALLAGPVIVMALVALAPGHVRDRMFSVFDTHNQTNMERIYLWRSGLEIIADYPMFGVGQNSFPIVYPRYRNPNVKEPNISHLHNNFLEIGAERGLVGLACWASIWGWALWLILSAWRKREKDDVETAIALCAGVGGIAAFLSAGMFEYNFGDAEIQMLYYFILAVSLSAVSRSVVNRSATGNKAHDASR